MSFRFVAESLGIQHGANSSGEGGNSTCPRHLANCDPQEITYQSIVLINHLLDFR